VLITRPIDQADDFAMQLWEAGAEPIVAPTIAIGPPDDVEPAQRAVAAIRTYTWVVFTSRNGVDAFFDALATRGNDARALGDTRVAAIGPKTAAALAQRGVLADFVPGQYVNEDVAAGLLERTSASDRILIFRAQEAREVLPETLREHGRNVDVVAAYATRSVIDDAVVAGVRRADIVTFTSNSSVTGFLANVDDAATELAGKTVAVIGPVTARGARSRGITVDVVADEFTIEGLMRALAVGASA
jgi:uroporphyrinogen III methyltransferase/synthase